MWPIFGHGKIFGTVGTDVNDAKRKMGPPFQKVHFYQKMSSRVDQKCVFHLHHEQNFL